MFMDWLQDLSIDRLYDYYSALQEKNTFDLVPFYIELMT